MNKKIYKVKDWNRKQKARNSPILVYTLGNGSILDTPRTTGYVVGDNNSSHFYSNINKAKEALVTI